MRKPFKKVVAALLAASLLIPMSYSESKGSNAITKAAVENETTEEDGSSGLTQLEKLKATSVDGKIEVRIWKSDAGKFYYSAYRNGHVTLKCAPLGLVAKSVDLSTGLSLDEESIEMKKGKEEYDLLQGSSSHVDKEYQEMSFVVTKGNSRMKVIFRIFADGIGYRYEVDEDTTKEDEVTVITSEESAFEFPMDATLWAPDWYSSTYEPASYSARKMENIKKNDTTLAPAVLAKAANGDSDVYMLISEANVYNEEKPYCATIFRAPAGSAALKVSFSKYLKQEQDPEFVGKTFQAEYLPIESVSMENQFHTPWRLCIMTDNLEDLSNSSLVTDLNPPAEGDFSWVEPGTASWSWWSTTSDAIDYDSMFDYIDYAKETGQKYCLVDFGWENWPEYETKLKTLCEYANERGVGILVWYGVKKRDQPHRVDLDRPETIEKEFAWCESLGIKGVKVDYLESDSQFAMKVMYDVASIAAKHKLVVNYHGCTDPNGENRTFPNILSSEAVEGSEYFKWSNGSPIETLLTLPYTRNVIGSMEFTPVCTSVKNCKATDGFMLAMPVVYESAMQTLAHSCYVYPGYGGLSFLTDIPSSWDESRLLAGSEPRKAAIRARRKGDLWYLGAMTAAETSYDISLDFLDKDQKYYAYIYTDKEDSSGIQMEKREVTSTDKLTLNLKKYGGCAIKFSKDDNLKTTKYDNYNYYEAEDANLGASSKVVTSGYVSRQKFVNRLKGAQNRIKFENIEAPEAGMYEVQLYVVSASKATLNVRANQYEDVVAKDLVGIQGDGNAVGCKSTKVYLDKGVNTLYVYAPTGTNHGIDRIAVSKTAVEAGTKPATTDTNPELYLDYPLVTPTPEATATPVPTAEATATPVPTATATPVPDNKNVVANNQGLVVTKPGKVKGLTVKSKKKKQMTVKFSKMSNVKGYQISYSTNKKFKRAKTITVTSTSRTIKKLKSKKNYYVRVRAIRKSGTSTLKGSWSAVKKVKIK